MRSVTSFAAAKDILTEDSQTVEAIGATPKEKGEEKCPKTSYFDNRSPTC